MNFRKKMTGREIAGYLLLAVSVILLGRSVTLCFSRDIWYDELFTVGMIEHSYGDLIAFTARDVHPPLYYCIVKLVVDLCKLISAQTDPVAAAKLVSTLPYFGLLCYSVTLIRRNFGMFTGGLFFFCVIAMPQLPAYTVEVRMYSWALLFVTAAFLHAYGTLTSDAPGSGAASAETGMEQAKAAAGGRGRCFHAAAFLLYGIAAAYTQYFACVAVVMIYLCVLLVFVLRDRGRIREWLLWVGISVAAYLPWLLALYRQITAVRENYWILPLTWRSLGGCVKFLMKPAFMNDTINTVLAVILTAGYVAVFARCGWKYKLEHNGRVFKKGADNQHFIPAVAGLTVLAGVVGFGFAASMLLRPIFVYRYMIPAMGCFWLCFALCMDSTLCKPKNNAAKEVDMTRDCRNATGRERLISGLALVLMALIVVVGLRDYRAFMGEEEYKTVCMRDTESALSLIGPEDTVLYNFDQVQAVTGYYLPETVERLLWRVEGEKLIQEITSPCGMAEEVEEIRRLLEETQDDDQRKNVWFVGSFNSRDDIVDEWRSAGLAVEEKGSFLLERYWFNLYRISISDHNTFRDHF